MTSTDRPEPGPEMRKLTFLIGAWKATDKYEKTALIPNGGEGSGIYETMLGPGGLSLLTNYHYRGPHGESIGLQVLTWDPKEARYMGYVFSSTARGCILISGDWEGPALVLSGEFENPGRRVAFKEIYSDITDRTMILKQYNSIDGGPSQLFGTTLFKRI